MEVFTVLQCLEEMSTKTYLQARESDAVLRRITSGSKAVISTKTLRGLISSVI